MEKVGSITDLSTGSEYVYHLTAPENEHDITVQGIRASLSVDKWYRVNNFLSIVKEEESSISNVPDDRATCIFAFPDISDVKEHISQNIVFTIDTSRLDSSGIYQANDDLVTQIDTVLQQKSHMNAEDVVESRVIDADAKVAYDLAVDYWNSMEQVSSIVDNGEILICRDVDTGSIPDYYTQ